LTSLGVGSSANCPASENRRSHRSARNWEKNNRQQIYNLNNR